MDWSVSQVLTEATYALLHLLLFSAVVTLLCVGVSWARLNRSRSRWWDARREMAEYASAERLAATHTRGQALDLLDRAPQSDSGAQQEERTGTSGRRLGRVVVRAVIGVLALVGFIALFTC